MTRSRNTISKFRHWKTLSEKNTKPNIGETIDKHGNIFHGKRKERYTREECSKRTVDILDDYIFVSDQYSGKGSKKDRTCWNHAPRNTERTSKWLAKLKYNRKLKLTKSTEFIDWTFIDSCDLIDHISVPHHIELH
jgi:hypothetical protein